MLSRTQILVSQIQRVIHEVRDINKYIGNNKKQQSNNLSKQEDLPHMHNPSPHNVSGPLYPWRSQGAEDLQVFLVRLVPRFPEPIASGRLSESTKDEAKSTEGNLTNKGLSPN